MINSNLIYIYHRFLSIVLRSPKPTTPYSLNSRSRGFTSNCNLQCIRLKVEAFCYFSVETISCDPCFSRLVTIHLRHRRRQMTYSDSSRCSISSSHRAFAHIAIITPKCWWIRGSCSCWWLALARWSDFTAAAVWCQAHSVSDDFGSSTDVAHKLEDEENGHEHSPRYVYDIYIAYLTILFVRNIAKCWPIFKILSPLDSPINLK